MVVKKTVFEIGDTLTCHGEILVDGSIHMVYIVVYISYRLKALYIYIYQEIVCSKEVNFCLDNIVINLF